MRYLHVPVPEPVHFLPRCLQKQAGAQSEEWVQRYYDLKQGKGLYHMATSMITLFGPRFRSSLFAAPPSIDTSLPVDS